MDSNIFGMAMNEIKKRHMRAVNENDARIQEVNNRIPQFKQINDALFSTGKELIRIIAEGKDVAQKTEQLKQYNLDAQAMSKQLLSDYGYPVDYLNIHFTCPKCKDTGYVNSSYCDCFHKLYGKLAADKLNRNAQISLCSFDTFNLNYYKNDTYISMQKIYNQTVNYARNFSINSENLLLCGQTGLGKTHLSLSIANEVIKKGYTVIYDSTINILNNIESEHFGRSNTDMSDAVITSDLLILDDLGTEYAKPFYASTIYNIINTRINRCLPTIISTNLNFEGLQRRYEPRVVSRLASQYNCLEFKGEDIRFLMKRQKQT